MLLKIFPWRESERNELDRNEFPDAVDNNALADISDASNYDDWEGVPWRESEVDDRIIDSMVLEQVGGYQETVAEIG